MTWLPRLLLALALLVVFFVGIFSGILKSDHGNKWVHHSWFVLIGVFPEWYYVPQIVGLLVYADDLAQHLIRRWKPTFESPLHALGNCDALVALRWRIIDAHPNSRCARLVE